MLPLPQSIEDGASQNDSEVGGLAVHWLVELSALASGLDMGLVQEWVAWWVEAGSEVRLAAELVVELAPWAWVGASAVLWSAASLGP